MAGRAHRQERNASGRVTGSVKNTGTQMGSEGSVKPIKNAVGMCGVKEQGYKKIKGTVSG